MRILFLHGWKSVPGGRKPSHLADHGHQVVNPALPDDDFPASVRIANQAYIDERPDVIVGSSRGGAVAINMQSKDTPLVLLCPAWKNWGIGTTVKTNTIILHSRADGPSRWRAHSPDQVGVDTPVLHHQHHMTDGVQKRQLLQRQQLHLGLQRAVGSGTPRTYSQTDSGTPRTYSQTDSGTPRTYSQTVIPHGHTVKQTAAPHGRTVKQTAYIQSNRQRTYSQTDSGTPQTHSQADSVHTVIQTAAPHARTVRQTAYIQSNRQRTYSQTDSGTPQTHSQADSVHTVRQTAYVQLDRQPTYG